MLSDLRQLCVHHPSGFTSCKVGLWFLPAWRRYHSMYSTNCDTPRFVHPIRVRTLTAISLPSSTFLATILICPLRLLAARPPFPLPSSSGRFNTTLSAPTALLQSFVFRHLRTLSVFAYHLTLASLSVAHSSRKTPGVWPPLVAGRRPPATLPLSPLFPQDTQKQGIMGGIDRVTFMFYFNFSARRHFLPRIHFARCWQPRTCFSRVTTLESQIAFAVGPSTCLVSQTCRGGRITDEENRRRLC
jgi:hypothetical protein